MDISFQFNHSQYGFRLEGNQISPMGQTPPPDALVADIRRFLADGRMQKGKGLEEYLIELGVDHIDTVHGDIGRELDRDLQEAEKEGFQGSAFIGKKKRPFLKKGYGEGKKGHRNSSMTTFRIASLTKAFTAAAICRLIDQEKLELDDDLEKYFPIECSKNDEWKQITIRMLLNHTSGMKNTDQIVKSEQDPLLSTYQAPEHIMSILVKHELLFQPGTKYHYSNPGYILLAILIERIAHMKYSEAIDELVLRPLGLYYTSAPMDLAEDVPGAFGHSALGEELYPPHTSIRIGTGNMISNIHDLLIWSRAIFNPSFLSPKMIAEISKPHPMRMFGNEERLAFYSLGWREGALKGKKSYFHTGIFPGCRSMLLMVPEDELELILLVNRDYKDKHAFRTFGETLAEKALSY